LDKYNGLVYSKSVDGGYCKFCVLFAQSDIKGQQLSTLVNRPLTNFKKALDALNKHFEHKFHQMAVQRAKDFIDVTTYKAVSIDLMANTCTAKVVAENRLKLRSIAATVIFVAIKLLF